MGTGGSNCFCCFVSQGGKKKSILLAGVGAAAVKFSVSSTSWP